MSGDSITTGIEKEKYRLGEKAKFLENKKKFDYKIQELANKATDFYLKYGEDDWRTGLLVNFLDMSLLMQDCMETIEAFDIGNEIIFGAMELMGQSLKLSEHRILQIESPTSPFKQKLIMWKAVRNTKKTVKSLMFSMKTSMEMAAITVGMYEDLSYSMSSMMARMNGRRLKNKEKQAKSAANGSMSSASSRGMDMIRKILEEQGKTSPDPTTPPRQGGSGTDDISDIA